MRFEQPGGKLAHAEIKIGDSPIMLADEHPAMGAVSPSTLGGTAVHLLLYFPDVDAQFANALAAGGASVRPVADQEYGGCSGTLEDPFGHVWTLATHKENVSVEEVQRRYEEKRSDG